MTTSAYPALTTAQKIFKSVVWDSLVAAALTYFLGTVMAIPVVGPVLRYIITSFTDVLYNGMCLCMDLEAIVLVNEAHKAAYNNASVQLKIVAHDKGIDSPEFRSANEKAKQALAKFVSFGGT